MQKEMNIYIQTKTHIKDVCVFLYSYKIIVNIFKQTQTCKSKRKHTQRNRSMQKQNKYTNKHKQTQTHTNKR